MFGEIIDTMANIEYGLLIAICIEVLMLFVLASIKTNSKLNVLSYIIAGILLVPLTYQMSRLVGAFNISNTASTINEIVGVVSPTLSKYVSSVAENNIGWFIFRRIMWSILLIGIAGFCIYVTMDKKRTRNHNLSNIPRTGRRYYSRTSRRHQ